jgi:acetyl CoA:N6-hydroxylysine acetyl transferase
LIAYWKAPTPSQPEGSVYERFDAQRSMRVSFRRVDVDADLPLFHVWMNEICVACFWDLVEDEAQLRAYLERIEADLHTSPLIAGFEGDPAGYFEIYWAMESRLGPIYDAHDYDRGYHGLIRARHHLGLAKTAAWPISFSSTTRAPRG